MKQLGIILILFMAMNLFAVVDVSASDPLVIKSIVVTSEKGLFVGDISKFRITVENNNSEVRSDVILVTLSPQVSSFTPINLTVEGKTTKYLDLQFQSQNTGPVTITTSVQGSGVPSVINNEINYFNYGVSTNILEENYYPVSDSNKKMTVISTVSNNGTQSVDFVVTLKLIDSRGSLKILVPKSIAMSSGTPPSPIPTNSQFNITLLSGAQATITSEYVLTSSDPTGPWTNEIVVQPTLYATPARKDSDQTNVMSPDVSLDLEAVGIYELGKSMVFSVRVTNNSDVEAYIEELTVQLLDSKQIDKLKGNVVVKMDSKLGTSMYGVRVPISEARRIPITIELDKGLTDSITNYPYWDADEQYTIQVTAYIRGRDAPLPATQNVALQPFNPPVKVFVKTPSTFKKNEKNTITVVLTNTTENPINNMVIRFGVTGPQEEKIVPDPSQLVGVNLEPAIWGGTTYGNIKEIKLAIVPRNDGMHKLEYAFNDNMDFNPTPIEFYVSAVPPNHNVQLDPTPTLASNQFVIGNPITFPISIVNKGTYSEYFSASVDVTSADGSFKEGTLDIGNGNIEPGEVTARTVTIPTTDPLGVGLGDKTAIIKIRYNDMESTYQVAFSVISPFGTNFTAVPTYDDSITVGEQSIMRVTLTNNHDYRAHYNIVISPDPNLAFTRTSDGWDLGPAETKIFEFPFQPRSESVGSQVVQVRVNSQVAPNAQFLIISKVEAEKKATEGKIFDMTWNTIIGIVAVIVIIAVVIMVFRSRRKQPAQIKPSQQYNTRRARLG